MAIQTPRVLIVDDEQELVSALVERLALRGVSAEGVTAGDVALERIVQRSFDVVVLDVKMPGLGGIDLLQRIKEDQPAIQVVLLTGHSSAQDAERGMSLGAFEYLVKPVKIEDLVRVLRAAAEHARSAGRSHSDE
jgi:DNA-binding NtrC family response regulator